LRHAVERAGLAQPLYNDIEYLEEEDRLAKMVWLIPPVSLSLFCPLKGDS
jgi:hypothetical protein